MAATRLIWTDQGISMLLEALQSRESLWNTKAECDKNRNMKKNEYAELIQILKEEIPGIDLPALKGKIQSLRTTFRDEIRKIKKSQGTGSGAADVYVPKWRYFEECSFLENVICSNRPCLSNMSASSSNDNDDDSMNLEPAEDEFSLPSPDNDSPSAHPKKRKKVPWMETAATALSELAKEAKESKETTSSNLAKEEDEWDVFGSDVANSIRALGNSDWQRRVKFAVQTAIFQTTAQQRAPPNYAAYNVQENNGGLNYHNLLPPGN